LTRCRMMDETNTAQIFAIMNNKCNNQPKWHGN